MNRPVILLTSLFNLLTAAALHSQVAWEHWSKAPGANEPPTYDSAAMAHDVLRDRSVLIGYPGGAHPTPPVWEWDGSAWHPRAPGYGPTERRGHRLVYDAARGWITLFGGMLSSGAVRNDVWIWDGSAWTEVLPPVQPQPRRLHAMAYDAARGWTLMYGGLGGALRPLPDTWKWDGARWARQSTPISPGSRSEHAMAWDATRERAVLFGGWDGGQVLADTWEWDGASWMQAAPAARPPARRAHAMAWDAVRERIVMFGGVNDPQGAVLLDDVWEWDGVQWRERLPATAPAARRNFAMTFDAVSDRILLFGGRDASGALPAETWRYGPVYPAAFTPYGTGCASTAGIPALGSLGNGLPWRGDLFTLELAPLPPSNLALIYFGSSGVSWHGLPLPVGLDPLGMPGCTLYVPLEVGYVMTPSGGVGTYQIPLLIGPRLLGLTVFAQGIVWDPPANSAGLAWSNAAAIFLGGR